MGYGQAETPRQSINTIEHAERHSKGQIMTTLHESMNRARDLAKTKPHITLLYSGRGGAEKVWRCQQLSPVKSGVVNVGDGNTPKEAFDFCTNAHKYQRFVG